MKIHIIRHGLTEGNLNNEYSGWHDTPLSKQGIEELETLKKTVVYPNVDVHFSSDLSRAKDTHALIFGEEAPVIHLEELREIHFGEFEGKTVAETNNVPFFDGFLKDVRVANGETYTEFAQRVGKGIEIIKHHLIDNNLTDASLVCHSGVVKTVLMLMEGLPNSAFYELSVPNGRGIVISFDENGKYTGYEAI